MSDFELVHTGIVDHLKGRISLCALERIGRGA